MQPQDQIQIQSKYVAIIRERLGRSEELKSVAGGSRAGDVLDLIAGESPSMAGLMPAILVMVNQEYAPRDQILRDGDEVALIPPVSGGADSRWFRVQREVLDPRLVESLVMAPAVGGIVTFSGTVRDNARGKGVVALDYEAYEPVAEKMLARVGEEARQQWSVERIAIVHRTGRLEVGETSVVIAVSAAHRAEAFAACQYAIDRIKEIVPIWKKEFYEDGSHWVGTEAEYQRETRSGVIASG